MANFMQKLSISLGSAGLFTIVNLPQTYQFTNSLQLLPQPLYSNGCPTNVGLIVHTIVFFVLTYLSMGDPTERTGIKLKHSLYGTLIFFLISSPAVFSLVGSLLGEQYADSNGCPTLTGVGLHALVYCVALVAVMYLPEKITVQ